MPHQTKLWWTGVNYGERGQTMVNETKLWPWTRENFNERRKTVVIECDLYGERRLTTVSIYQEISQNSKSENKYTKRSKIKNMSSLCCVLGQDTQLSQRLSPPRCITGCRRIVGENLTKCVGVTSDGLASRPGEVEILLAASCYRNRDKLRQLWASWLQGFTLFLLILIINLAKPEKGMINGQFARWGLRTL